jgi:glycine oxidase
MPDSKPHIIIGGGIMGLAIGWRLLSEGAEHVVIFEAGEAARSSAAWVAAGMLSPRAEAGFEDMDIYEEGVRSLDLYPQFLDELRSEAGDLVPRLDRSGILVLATNADEVRELDRQYDFRKRANIPVERLSGDATREREPLLSTKVTASLWLEQEAQINNRQLCLALKAAFLTRGGVMQEHCKISEVITKNGRAIGVRAGNEEFEGSSITIAAGAWSSTIGGITPAILVRPVKGQMIGLRMTPQSKLKQPIRAPRVYIVPKDDGRLLVGATAEEAGFDPRIIAGSIMELLHFAWEIIPAIYDLEIEEMLASFRPATRNHRSIVGRSEMENLYYATGHWRHGILMAPLTSYRISREILGIKA